MLCPLDILKVSQRANEELKEQENILKEKEIKKSEEAKAKYKFSWVMFIILSSILIIATVFFDYNIDSGSGKTIFRLISFCLILVVWYGSRVRNKK